MPRYWTREAETLEAEKCDIEKGNRERSKRSTSPVPTWSGPQRRRSTRSTPSKRSTSPVPIVPVPQGSNVAAPRSSSVPPNANYVKPAQQSLEELSPESYQLIYLKRYARYMALWQPYDTEAKHCIGIGLISLCHCTAYYSLGQLIPD